MSKEHRRGAIIGLSPIGAGPIQDAPHSVQGEVMGRTHAAAYAQLKGTIEIVAYCDILDERLASFRETWGEVWPDAVAYKDYREMFEKEEIDVLSVCTPDHLHADIVVGAAETGVPAILCEKPLATTLEDVDRMLSATEAHGTAISVDHTSRWFPIHRTARRMIDDGVIGQPRIVVALMSGPRAMLFRNGTHHCDLIHLYAGAPPAWVVGRLQDTFQDYGPVYAGDGGHAPSTDPGCEAWFGFQNGVSAHFLAQQGMIGTEVKYGAWDVIGEEGAFHIDGSQIVHLFNRDGHLCRTIIGPDPVSRSSVTAAVQELIDVVDGRRQAGELISPAQGARWVVEMLLGVLRSSHAGMKRLEFPLPRD
jgi:predicted dehydrogenase